MTIKIGLSEEVVDSIIDELLERRGFENFWYDLEDDDREEILENLYEITEENLEDL